MSIKFKTSILDRILIYLPLLLLFVSVFNEFDFNYFNYKYFSFNFPYILIFYWSLKRIDSLGYALEIRNSWELPINWPLANNGWPSFMGILFSEVL